MRSLKRLKDFLTGEEKENDKKTAEPEIPETAKEEKEVKGEATVKEKEIKKPKEAEETSIPEEKLEPKKEIVEEVKKDEPKPKRSENMTLLNREENKLTREDVDPEFKQQMIDAGVESLALCFQCGTCTGACPSGRRTPYRIRQIVRKALMGLKEEVITDDTLWMCSTCYECQERCPRKVKIVDVVKTARNFAAQAGYMAPAHKMVGSFVLKTGHGVPINDATMKLRKRVGLNELPPTTHEYPEALEEVQKILKKTGFDGLIGYNWEKGELE